jgi:UPF0271 protein
MIQKIDLNCDLGESYGLYDGTRDKAIMPYLSSCNIACGFHSGDPSTIMRTIRLAMEHGVAIGAHPSYPDLQGFGRRVMHLSASEIEAIVLYQVGALKTMTEALGGRLHHVKPHGALYNHAAADEETARGVVNALLKLGVMGEPDGPDDGDRPGGGGGPDSAHNPGSDHNPDANHSPKGEGPSARTSSLILYAPPNSVLCDMATEAGIPVRREVFADRRYEQDLRLRSRVLAGAVLHNRQDVLDQLEGFLHGTVHTYGGETKPITAETLCLHSDTEGAELLAREIHAFLTSRNVQITSK